MNKKILIATGLFPPDIGGPATYSKLLVDELPKRNILTKVVSFGEVRHLPKGVKHIVYFFKIIFRSRGYDMIYAQDPVSVGLPVCLASCLTGKPFFLKVVGDYAWEQGVQRYRVTDSLDEFSIKKDYAFPVRAMKYIQTAVAHRARKVVVPSNYLRNIVMNWGINGDSIAVVYNSFELSEESPLRDKLRKDLGLSGDVIVSVGRLVPWKGFKGLIEVFARLHKVNPLLRLIIIGDGPDRKLLEGHARMLEVENKVVFTGKLPQHEVFGYVKAADVFVLNTAYEGFSHQILEVLAIGTPCVTTNVGGNTEIIRDKENGLLIRYNDLEQMGGAIEQVLNDKIFAKAIVSNGHRTLLGFSRDKMISGLVDVFSI